jgi:hypothetical protein
MWCILLQLQFLTLILFANDFRETSKCPRWSPATCWSKVLKVSWSPSALKCSVSLGLPKLFVLHSQKYYSRTLGIVAHQISQPKARDCEHPIHNRDYRRESGNEFRATFTQCPLKAGRRDERQKTKLCEVVGGTVLRGLRGRETFFFCTEDSQELPAVPSGGGTIFERGWSCSKRIDTKPEGRKLIRVFLRYHYT